MFVGMWVCFCVYVCVQDLYGVGLVFRTGRDGKMIVASFLKESSAYECGLVRDGGVCLCLHVCARACMRACERVRFL